VKFWPNFSIVTDSKKIGTGDVLIVVIIMLWLAWMVRPTFVF
jgi:hypothetical protein